MASEKHEPDWLKEAARIGAHLQATAIRSRGRCSWVGRSARELAQVGGVFEPTVAALGPDLYDGTAGVALFLAQLHAATGEQETKTIALGAITHALDESKRSTSQLGLYQGWTGIAFAAARVGVLLDTPALVERGRALLSHLEATDLENSTCDVISGIAGAMIAILSLPREARQAGDIDVSERLGTALADAASPWETSWAWSTKRAMGDGPSTATSQPLTGLSHGTAGMGIALLELASRTSNSRFADVGRGALAYEASVFDEESENWPDFRINDWNPKGRSLETFGWCHGGPGIALTRLHALSLGENAHWRRDWTAAVSSSRRQASARFDPSNDATLCHGFAGVVEPLLEASRIGPPPARKRVRDELTRLWAPLCKRFGGLTTWPSGLPSRGPNPSLMLGTAGIGYTMLRMHDPTTPSVLLPLLGAPR